MNAHKPVFFLPATSMWAEAERKILIEYLCGERYIGQILRLLVLGSYETEKKDREGENKETDTPKNMRFLTLVLSSTTLSPSADTHNTALTVFFPLWEDRKVVLIEEII